MGLSDVLEKLEVVQSEAAYDLVDQLAEFQLPCH